MKKASPAYKAKPISAKPYDGNTNLWSVVAFQDEISRSLNLSDPTLPSRPKKQVPRTLPPLDNRPSATSRNQSSSLLSSSSPSRPSPTSTYRSPPPPVRPPASSRTHAPARTSTRVPAHTLANSKNKVNSVILRQDEIIVVEQKKQNLTLAQKMGLAPSPAAPLSQAEWEEVKKVSDTRHDSYLPCVICQDEFRMDGQVLLSCSHVFHKICLDSFEKYSKTKCCPLCRKEEYQKAQISEGKKVYLHKCATKIQAVYRGYRARKLFQQLLDANPPEDAERRKIFYARKLERATDKLLNRLERDRAMIDSSIHAMSHNVAASIAYLRSVGIGSMINPNSINWKDVTMQAKLRNTRDCPICIMPLAQSRKIPILLSCSHVFHETCIASFEHYNCETVHLCPVCRTMYHKTQFVVQ